MYTKNQLIIAGLLIAGASSIVTYMVTKGKETTSSFFGEKRKRKISTTSGEPISNVAGMKNPIKVITSTSGEPIRYEVAGGGEYWYRCVDANGIVFISSRPCNQIAGATRDTSRDKK